MALLVYILLAGLRWLTVSLTLAIVIAITNPHAVCKTGTLITKEGWMDCSIYLTWTPSLAPLAHSVGL